MCKGHIVNGPFSGLPKVREILTGRRRRRMLSILCIDRFSGPEKGPLLMGPFQEKKKKDVEHSM